MLKSFLKDCKITKLKGRAAAGQTDQTPAAALDMAGFDSVAFFTSSGDNTSGSVQELQVFGVATNAVSGGTEITDNTAQFTSASSSDGDDKIILVDVTRWNPAYRYAYCTWVIDTQNCESDGLYSIQYNARDLPITQWTGVVASGVVVAG